MFLLFLAGVSILIKKVLFIINYFINNKDLNDALLKVSPEFKTYTKEKN